MIQILKLGAWALSALGVYGYFTGEPKIPKELIPDPNSDHGWIEAPDDDLLGFNIRTGQLDLNKSVLSLLGAWLLLKYKPWK